MTTRSSWDTLTSDTILVLPFVAAGEARDAVEKQ